MSMLFKLPFAVLAMAVIITLFSTTFGLPSTVYSETQADANKILDSMRGNVSESLGSSEESVVPGGFIIDVIGLLIKAFLTFFAVIATFPSLLANFIAETMVLLGLGWHPVLSSLIEFIVVASQLYILILIIEWVRPGFLRGP